MKTYIVTGPPHSGTSLVAGLLKNNGVYMGGNFSYDNTNVPELQRANPKGYWEDREFAEVNLSILHAAGGSSRNPPPNPEQLEKAASRLDGCLPMIFKARMDEHTEWGFKDPRIVLLWEAYYRNLLPEMNAHIIICLRNPLAIARAWVRYDGVHDVKHGIRTAAIYMTNIGRMVTRSKWPVMLVGFENWWRRPDEQQREFDQFVGRDMDYSYFDERLWRS